MKLTHNIVEFMRVMISVVVYLGLLNLSACSPPVASDSTSIKNEIPSAAAADKLVVVDCLLPGKIHQLGQMTYLTARRAVKTTAQLCEIRGGEYVAYDRADLRTSLNVWLPKAQEGDKVAQNYVGEIFEQGAGVVPDYGMAASWYRKSADQGFVRAQVNLGHLYEKGLGVKRDLQEAMRWYRLASGGENLSLEPGGVTSEERAELAQLRSDIVKKNRELDELKDQLQSTEQELNRYKKQQRDSESLLQQEKDKYAKLQFDLQHEQAKLSDFERRQVDALIEKLNSTEGRLNTKEDEILALKSNLEEIKRAKDSSQISLVRTKEQELEEKNRAINSLKMELKVSQEMINELKFTKIVGLSKESEQLKISFKKKTDQVERLKQQIAELEDKTSSYQESIEKYKSVVVALAGPTIEIVEPVPTQTRGGNAESVLKVAAVRNVVGVVAAPAGLKVFTINGQPTEVTKAGVFSIDQSLADKGEAPVEVVAHDAQGKVARLILVLTKTPVKSQERPVTQALTGIRFGNYYALIIGNERYQKLSHLDNAVNDAKAIDRTLKERYGFKTTVLLNANRYDILSALNQFREKLTEKDNFLLYYAGHGELQKEISRGYWLPVDAEANNNANWIPVYQITDILNIMTAKQIMVISDSCYSGTFTRSSITKLEGGVSDEVYYNFLKKMADKKARTVLTSGGVQPVLDSGGGDHSVFAKVLLDILDKTDSVLEGISLFRKVKDRVLYLSETQGYEQIPEYAPIRSPEFTAEAEGGGDFLFVPVSVLGT